MPKKQKSETEIRAEIERDFAQWDEIMKNGCSDPFWPDGVNLNLKRNHIIYGMRKLQEAMSQPVQLSMFDEPVSVEGMRGVPPVVPDNYMVRNGVYAEIRIKRMREWGKEPVFEFEEAKE